MGSKNNILDEQFDSGTPVPTNKFVLDRNDFSPDTKKNHHPKMVVFYNDSSWTKN